MAAADRDAPLYHAPPPDAVIAVPMDAFLALFHRPSGTTHLLTEPAPQLLECLAAGPASLAQLLDRLATAYELADADGGALAARLEELVAAGLVRRA